MIGTMTRKSTYTDWDEVPLLLSVKEAGEVLGVHFNTVRKLISEGQLIAKKIGRAYKINRSDLRAYVESED